MNTLLHPLQPLGGMGISPNKKKPSIHSQENGGAASSTYPGVPIGKGYAYSQFLIVGSSELAIGWRLQLQRIRYRLQRISVNWRFYTY